MNQRQHKRSLASLILWPVYGFGCVAVGAFGADALSRQRVNPIVERTYRSVAKSLREAAPSLSTSCDIKGNISIDSGEKIYHVPGQSFYLETKISPQYGERWFCSEEEARAAGWRKAYR